MNVLDNIIAHKRSELEDKKKCFPVSRFENSVFFKREMPSFYNALAKKGPSIIGEFKRKSPSKGIINSYAEVGHVASDYEEAGISAMSILTDIEFFGGTDQDLQYVADIVKIPLLRKDFIVDEYQVVESKSIGASAILLIASVLSKKEICKLTDLSLNLGLDVLFEIHDEKEIEKVSQKIRIIGVNNRDLRTFKTGMDHSEKLFTFLPENCLKVAESGFQTYAEVTGLFNTGYNAFLIGEKFMRSKNPGKSAARFMKDLRKGME
jgi:indole-3-glycerol phosphate synthase